MVFVLNPYENLLDLTNRDDRKLFQGTCKVLKEEDKFSGRKAEYNNVVKLIGKSFGDVRLMEVLLIPIKWYTNNANDALKRVPTEAGMVNSFKVYSVTKAQVKAKSELVWIDTTFGADTPKYFARFGTAPVDTATLDVEQNKLRMKHVIIGKKVQDSFKSPFQIEIMGSNKEFKMSREYNGPMMWKFLRV